MACFAGTIYLDGIDTSLPPKEGQRTVWVPRMNSYPPMSDEGEEIAAEERQK